MVSESIQKRQEEDVRRPDLIQVMMDAMDKKVANMNLEEMFSFGLGLYFAGFDTSTTAICILADLLTIEPEI